MKRDKKLVFRVSPAEEGRYEKAAKGVRGGLSTWLRWLADEWLAGNLSHIRGEAPPMKGGPRSKGEPQKTTSRGPAPVVRNTGPLVPLVLPVTLPPTPGLGRYETGSPKDDLRPAPPPNPGHGLDGDPFELPPLDDAAELPDVGDLLSE